MAGDIPSWQRAAPPIRENNDANEQSKSSDTNTTTSAMVRQEQDTDSSHAVITDPNGSQMGWLEDNASEFLKNKKVVRAPVEKKLEFLESKGVSQEVGRQLMASESGGAADEEAEILTQEAPTQVETAPSLAPISTPAPPPPQQVAPIITYPEFLMHSSKRPPLVTTDALQKTGYIAAALAASMYCVSKLILDPMQEALTEARHDFLDHAGSKLRSLTERVTPLVSATPSTTKQESGHDVYGEIDKKSEAGYSTDGGDPTELYHRDIGTQTTPQLSRRNSLSSTSSSSSSTSPTKDPTTTHQSRLKSLTKNLTDYSASKTSSIQSEELMSTQLQQLTEYLNDMRYQSPYMSYKGPGVGGDKDKDDEIERVRADIRGIKGVLLSTRNFPRGGYR